MNDKKVKKRKKYFLNRSNAQRKNVGHFLCAWWWLYERRQLVAWARIFTGWSQSSSIHRSVFYPRFFFFVQLQDEDIVLVTINYRLGPFGFLSLNTPEYSGNMGVKDQLLALKWVNENIEYFGGNKILWLNWN